MSYTPLEKAIWSHFCDAWMTIGLAAQYDYLPDYLLDKAQVNARKCQRMPNIYWYKLIEGGRWAVISLRDIGGNVSSLICHNPVEIHHGPNGSIHLMDGKLVK